MDKTIRGKDINLVPIDTKCGFLDAVAEFIDPVGLSREGIEAIEERRIARGDVDPVAVNRRSGKAATVWESPVNFRGLGIDAEDP